jgi:hypothetical protein
LRERIAEFDASDRLSREDVHRRGACNQSSAPGFPTGTAPSTRRLVRLDAANSTQKT